MKTALLQCLKDPELRGEVQTLFKELVTEAVADATASRDAEIADLKGQLKDTNEQLRDTNAQLRDTNAQLRDTNAQLNELEQYTPAVSV